MSKFKIDFINHSSLLIQHGDNFFLTDPWYISPAFGKWVQYPFPLTESIKKILELDQEKLKIIISHGHDDHIDDFFIKNYLSNATCIIPKLQSKGFNKRVTSLFKKKPIEVGFDGKKIDGVKINSFTNQDFTHHDSIVTLSSDNEFIIHANDNWHEQPNDIMNKMINLSKNKITYYFSQLGIADSFPIKYEKFSLKEKKNIINDRCKNYIKVYVKNLLKINPKYAFSYANQARMENEYNLIPYNFILNQLKNHKTINQIFPGDVIDKLGLSKKKNMKQDLFDYLLNRLETKTNNYIKSKIGSKFKVKFVVEKNILKNKFQKNTIYYGTSVLNWLNIFSGKLNLESISIGGAGKILKDKKINIRDIHHVISEYAYIFQNRETKNLFQN